MTDTKMVKHHDAASGSTLFPWMSRQWLDDIFHDGFSRPMFAIEEFREGDEMVIRAELPGVDPDRDVELEVIDDTLVISAEKTRTHEHDDDGWHRSEFRYGSLTRVVSLPRGAKESDIVARYTDGVLEVRVPVPQVKGGGPHKIEVRRS